LSIPRTSSSAVRVTKAIHASAFVRSSIIFSLASALVVL
jgi:hypothetical protein